MGFQLEKANEVVIVALEGEINISNANEIRGIFAKLLQDGEKKILVDFQKVVFIDSSGLAVLIEVLKRLSAVNGKLRVYNVNHKIREIFEIVKLHKLISRFDDRASALGEF